MKNLTTSQIIMLGDIHGAWESVFDLLEAFDVKGSLIIQVGDVGIGFCNKDQQLDILTAVNEDLKARGNTLLAIRGNHDDPAYFDGYHLYSNLQLLPDYTSMTINGSRWLFVGGAISVDRNVVHRGIAIRRSGETWWPDEGFVYDSSRVVNCDVLVTHSAPPWVGPVDKAGISSYLNNDPTLWDECTLERYDIDKLIRTSGAKRHYCGHFHISMRGESRGCTSRILAINEMLEHR